eukprot:SAG31_NODE_5571_length_2450_cov_1.577201_2_plen_189_part_00
MPSVTVFAALSVKHVCFSAIAATGVNAIFYFAPTIFKDAGVNNPLLCAAATGLANLFGTFVGMKLVDTRGRRDLLIKGAFGMSASMLLAATLLLSPSSALGYVAVMFICIFIVNFAFSWGPVRQHVQCASGHISVHRSVLRRLFHARTVCLRGLRFAGSIQLKYFPCKSVLNPLNPLTAAQSVSFPSK